MGSTCRIGVWSAPDGPDPDQLLTDAVRLVDDLEAAWSRFRVDSELTRINRHAGIAVPVSQATLDLVALAVAAWERTDGRFDPTVGDAVVAAGYDRTFSELGIDGPPTTRQPTRVPGCSGIVVDHAGGTVTVPTGMRLDLGGIGKGRAADLTATLLAEAGALGAVVDLGGDVRTIGVAPEADQWVITVGDPDTPETTLVAVGIAGAPDRGATASLGGGAVATSTTLRRRWQGPDGPAHHLIDPATSRPSVSGVVMATVVAADATWAEVFAKAALLAGPQDGAELIASAGLAGLLVVDDRHGRRVQAAGDLGRFLVEVPGQRTAVDDTGIRSESPVLASTNRPSTDRGVLT
jgi:thiamine biosynthesis lipoprotein